MMKVKFELNSWKLINLWHYLGREIDYVDHLNAAGRLDLRIVRSGLFLYRVFDSCI